MNAPVNGKRMGANWQGSIPEQTQMNEYKGMDMDDEHKGMNMNK